MKPEISAVAQRQSAKPSGAKMGATSRPIMASRLSLLEAMHLGMPVVGLATTEAVEAVPAEAGVLATDPERLAAALRHLVHEPDAARLAGKAARAAALERYGLARFLRDWDALLAEVTL